jgi:hypothetical protein
MAAFSGHQSLGIRPSCDGARMRYRAFGHPGRGTDGQAGDMERGSARQGALHVPRGRVDQGKQDTGQAFGRASALRHVIG